MGKHKSTCDSRLSINTYNITRCCYTNCERIAVDSHSSTIRRNIVSAALSQSSQRPVAIEAQPPEDDNTRRLQSGCNQCKFGSFKRWRRIAFRPWGNEQKLRMMGSDRIYSSAASFRACCHGEVVTSTGANGEGRLRYHLPYTEYNCIIWYDSPADTGVFI